MIPRSARSIRGALLAGLLAMASACGDDEPAPVPAEVVEPTPEERLQGAVDVWNATDSFHFRLTVENRVIPLDQAGMLTYTTAEGDVVTPDRIQAQTTVRTPVGNAQVAFIGIGDQQWITNPLSRQWEPAPPGTADAVATAFDPAIGIGATLTRMPDVQYSPGESLNGTPAYRLSGTLPGTVMAGFAADLATVPTLDVDLVVTTDDNRIRRIVVRQPATSEGVIPTWTFDLSNFDQPVTIQPPL